MNFLKAILLISVNLLTALPAFSQQTISNGNIRKLGSDFKLTKDEVYIHYNELDGDSRYIYVHLINETDTTTTFSGYNQRIEFGWLGLDSLGQWVVLSKDEYRHCGTGYGDFEIQPNHYTSEKIDLDKYKGNYETKVRWFYTLGADTILSKEIDLAIDSYYWSSDIDRFFHKIEMMIRADDTPKENIENYKLLLVSKYYI